MTNKLHKQGGPVIFSKVFSSGSHTNEFGVGSLDVSIARGDSIYKFVDLGNINFAQPTLEQLRVVRDASPFSDGDKSRVAILRRLSLLQAEFVSDIIIKALQKELIGVIPSDEEIMKMKLK